MKIGIITMHKVMNFGSALQAYALQHKLEELGFDSEIIDYVLPSKRIKNGSIKGKIKGGIVFLKALVMGFPRKKMQRKFELFYRNFYRLSAIQYNAKNIAKTPPKYDVYMTGSDQVWNPRHIGDDCNFFLSFAPKGAYKMSYASSFATSHISDSHKDLYGKYLADYSEISVREPSGVQLVRELSGKDSTVCCDPVFLLSKDQWNSIADTSMVNIREKYILVYALYYMFDPYPELLEIVNHVQKQLGYKVVFLNGRTEDAFRYNSIVMKSEGPADFIHLVRNAEIVITSSFHGTAFSLIYEKPLMAIVKDIDGEDSRISSLLRRLHAEKSLIPYDKGCKLKKDQLYKLKNNITNITNYIRESEDYLRISLSKVYK